MSAAHIAPAADAAAGAPPRLMGDTSPGDVVSSMGAGPLVVLEHRAGWTRCAHLLGSYGYTLTAFHDTAWCVWHSHDPHQLHRVRTTDPAPVWTWEHWAELSVGTLVQWEGFSAISRVTGFTTHTTTGERIAVLETLIEASPTEGLGLMGNLCLSELQQVWGLDID